MNLTLRRSATGVPYATTGILTCATALVLYTIELPWRENEPDVSCVPAGDYDLIPYLSPKHGETWRLHNPQLNVYGTGFVPEGGRCEIEIHADNLASTLEGCIGVGLFSGELAGQVAVLESARAVLELRALLGSIERHTLIIIQE